jgi:iron-sulfur cluster repair protein YtfE (RIC family)
MNLEARTQSILTTHHAYLRTHMPRLDRSFREARVPKELFRPWSDLVFTMEAHMQKEEVILFPALVAVSRGAFEPWVVGPIEAMQAEHDDIREIEAKLRAVAHLAGPWKADLVALLDDLAEHARTEDEDLFPLARTRLAELEGTGVAGRAP